MKMLIFHHKTLLNLIKTKYALQDIQAISSLLHRQGTLDFVHLDNGLFPAAETDIETAYTGYASIWVRDNIHIAHAHYVLGKYAIAAKNTSALMQYFNKQRYRFEGIINEEFDARPMNRPHIRFNGHTLKEIDQKWAHAQNDALGYFLWFYCKLVNEGLLKLTPDDIDTLLLFPKYWQSIHYWEDEDSGHWEEVRKISASSIGVVIAALQSLETYLVSNNLVDSLDLIDHLIKLGQGSLKQILPAECIQNSEDKYRRYDSALLFLIYPLKVLDDEIADKILSDVIGNLQGEYGIRRYLGDSYWSADYKKKLQPELRTADFSDDISGRDALHKKGQEAQWCIFDPIISIIYGLKHQKTRCEDYLSLQTHYFNRSLGQITGINCELGQFLCPESYYLEDGCYVPSDPTPLYWTQANLICAFKIMEQNVIHP